MRKYLCLITVIVFLSLPFCNVLGQFKNPLNNEQYFLFAYFKGQTEGLHLALSKDGIHWDSVNNGKSILIPRVGSEKIMRDPSIHLGPDGIYRLVWTTGWKGKDIGYASSKDLINWSEQRIIPVGEHIDSTNNCWAPEIFFDGTKKQYMIYWSSNVGEFKKKGSEGRIYYVTTKDFKTFSESEILFQNGFPAGGAPGNNGPIDAFIYRDAAKRFILFYKKDDNSHIPNIYHRLGVSPEGPWQEEIGPILPSTGDEGPSCVRINNRYCVFTDPFESPYAYLFSSDDLLNWTKTVTDLKMAHGTVVAIPRKTAIKIRNWQGK